MQQEPSGGFLNKAKGMRVGLGQATLAAEKGPRVRPRKSCQSIIQVVVGSGGELGKQ